jgi:hypothetical protein
MVLLSFPFLLQLWSTSDQALFWDKTNLAVSMFHHSDCLILVLFKQNDYYNMMKGPIDPHLQFAIRTLIAQNQQFQQNLQMARETASSSGTMNPVFFFFLAHYIPKFDQDRNYMQF